MTISKRVQKELVQAVPPADVAAVRSLTGRASKLLPPQTQTQTQAIKSRGQALRATTEALAAASKGKAWTREEHERFLVALELYPSGPWKAIADYVGSKNSRQTMTHAQKYRQKHERRLRGLRNKPKKSKSKSKSRSRGRSARTSAKTRAAAAADQVEDQSPRAVDVSMQMAVDAVTVAVADGAAFSETATPLAESTDAAPRSWNWLLKQASATEIFPDFEPMELLPDMWSTNSLEEVVLGSSGARFDFFSAEPHAAVV